jgi:hypothetical protein
MLWQSAKGAHGIFERSVKKKQSMFKVGGLYSEVVHLYAKIECTSTTVQNKEVLNLTGFNVPSFYTHVDMRIHTCFYQTMALTIFTFKLLGP